MAEETQVMISKKPSNPVEIEKENRKFANMFRVSTGEELNILVKKPPNF